MTILHIRGLTILWHIHTILCLSLMFLLFPVLTIFPIICPSHFFLIFHSRLIFPQSLSLLRVLHRIPRLHLFPSPRLLLARAIITVSVLPVTCLRYQVSYLLVVLLIVFHTPTCWISYALVFWPPYNKPQLNVCPMLGRGRLVFQTGMSLPTSWSNLPDSGTVSGWTVAVFPQVLFIKSSGEPRIGISMWSVVWGVDNCISLVAGLALLCWCSSQRLLERSTFAEKEHLWHSLQSLLHWWVVFQWWYCQCFRI